MSNNEFTLPSGAVLTVTPAPFSDAKRLQNEIIRAAKGTGVGEIDVAKLRTAFNGQPEAALNMLAETLASVVSSEAVDAALMKCAERAVYRVDGSEAQRKVDRGLFDDPVIGDQARGDYYSICMRLAEVNVVPFFKAIFSAFEARARNGIAAPTSK